MQNLAQHPRAFNLPRSPQPGGALSASRAVRRDYSRAARSSAARCRRWGRFGGCVFPLNPPRSRAGPRREAVSSRTPLCRGTAPWRLPRPEGERGARHVLPGVPGALQHRHQGLRPVSAGGSGSARLGGTGLGPGGSERGGPGRSGEGAGA